MSASPILLIGVGGAGSAIARGVNRAFGGELRHLLTDTDAASGQAGSPFVLLGGNRLSGHGTGGDIVAARSAAEESCGLIDDALAGVRLAVLVTGLGGGTGGGATLEIVKHLSGRGIPSLVFATTPFAFESETRQRTARGIMSMIEDVANATFFIPLDQLVEGVETMDEAMRRAVDTLATGITLFWRLVEKPGYIRLGVEDLRRILAKTGRARFAAVTVTGPERAREAVDRLVRSKLLAVGAEPAHAILCGILAGADLRLAEIGEISDGLQDAFGRQAEFHLATVNDESTFGGRLAAVTMVFEASTGRVESGPRAGRARRGQRASSVLEPGSAVLSRFNNVTPTQWHGFNLDTPTYVRKNITLDP